jgi:type I restriction enzyme, S subunit
MVSRTIPGPQSVVNLGPARLKLTDASVLPTDWHTTSLKELSRNIIDFRGRTPRKLGMDWGGGDIPALSARNVKMGGIDLQEETHFGSDALYRRWMTKGDAEKGDIVITTEAPLGNVALIPDKRKYILSQRAVLLQVDPSQAVSTYLFQLMMSDGFQRSLSSNASGSTATGIQRRRLEELELRLPPLPEQRPIADALADIDATIGALHKLIAKQRAVKLATMQQLLRGTTRLGGFSGDWRDLQMGDLADVRSGATPQTRVASFWGGDIPWCTPTDITSQPGKYLWATERTITGQGLASCGATLLPRGTLLLCSRATIGEVKIATVPVATNQGFKSLVVKAGVSNEFLYYLVLTLRSRLIERATGSTFLEIGKRDLKELSVKIPDTNEEQQAIAEVLSDIDHAITRLTQVRDKMKVVKSGMMQSLLTGHVRLKKREASA